MPLVDRNADIVTNYICPVCGQVAHDGHNCMSSIVFTRPVELFFLAITDKVPNGGTVERVYFPAGIMIVSRPWEG